MDIPVSAEVQCIDGPGGRSTCVILNPISHRVTQFVVKEPWFPHAERLVPVELVTESTAHQIHLRCTQDELKKLEFFTETRFVRSEVPYSVYGAEEYRILPYVLPDPDLVVPTEYERVPPGELAVHRGARVEAKDGHVGQVDEFLLDPSNMHITHLVLRAGHVWGQKDVTIPVSEIERIEEDTVYLKLDKHSVERLPGIPLQRRYQGLTGV